MGHRARALSVLGKTWWHRSVGTYGRAPDADKVKHNSGNSDVDAVGDPNVGWKTGVGSWYGVEKHVSSGSSYAQQVEATVKLIQNR